MAADARGGERRARPRVQRGFRLLLFLGLLDFLLRASVLGHVILPYKWIIAGGAGSSLPTPDCGRIFFTFQGSGSWLGVNRHGVCASPKHPVEQRPPAPGWSLTARFGANENPLADARGSDRSPDREGGVVLNSTISRSQRTSVTLLTKQ